MFKIFIALASFQVLNSIHGFCMVCASTGHGITAKSFSDSVMNPKRPLTPNANCGSPASVEYPSLGSLGWDSCSTGAQREHESRGSLSNTAGDSGVTLCWHLLTRPSQARTSACYTSNKQLVAKSENYKETHTHPICAVQINKCG